jgi:hypothetical protein
MTRRAQLEPLDSLTSLRHRSARPVRREHRRSVSPQFIEIGRSMTTVDRPSTDSAPYSPPIEPVPQKRLELARHRSPAENLALLFTVLTALATTASAVLMVVSNRTQERLAAAEAYVNLKQRYYLVADNLPAGWNADTGALYQRDGATAKEWTAVSKYWYQSFDEWYSITRVQKAQQLWDEYYSEALYSSLQKRRLRSVLCDMQEDSFLAGKARAPFVAAMQDLWKNGQMRAPAMCPVQ